MHAVTGGLHPPLACPVARIERKSHDSSTSRSETADYYRCAGTDEEESADASDKKRAVGVDDRSGAGLLLRSRGLPDSREAARSQRPARATQSLTSSLRCGAPRYSP